jgi:hypothetical protein
LPETFTNEGCNCGANYNQLNALKRKASMLKPKFMLHKNTAIREPELIQCSLCDIKFSPQYLLRKWIISNFPNTWPPTSGNVSDADLIEEERKNSTHKLKSDLKTYNHLLKEYIPDSEDLIKNNDFYLELMTMPVNFKELEYTKDIQNFILSYLVISNNMHWYYHCHSCVKGCNSNCLFCRYDFPKCLIHNAIIKPDEILLERNIGHEYINGFNDVLMSTFKCNHDIKVMIGGTEMAERIYYCCKYVTKNQNSVDSNALLQTAFDNRLNREEIATNLNSEMKSRQRVGSMIIQLSNGRMEIPGNLAVFYIFNKSCAYKSHTYSRFNLNDYLIWLLNKDNSECTFDIQLSEESPTYKVSRKIDDYIYRNNSLENISVYWFYTKYHKAKFTLDCDKSKKLIFLNDHPQVLSHYLASYDKASLKIPVNYLKIPYYKKCDTNELRDRHSQLTLLLFKPFRSINDLKHNDSTWDEEFHNWLTVADSKSLAIYNNMQDYYTGRILASQTQQLR